MRIRNFLTDAGLWQELSIHLSKGNLIPIFGSGFSKDFPSKRGIVPNGSDLKNYMLDKLKEKLGDKIDSATWGKKSLSDIASYYESAEHGIPLEERRKYVRNRFTEVELGDLQKNLLKVEWPRIYTLNVDDAIERATNLPIIVPMRKYNKEVIATESYLFKLHGDARTFLTYPEEQMIFSKKSYVRSLTDNWDMLAQLEDDMMLKDIIYIGCSLDDEIDLLNIAVRTQKKEGYDSKTYFLGSSSPPLDVQINLSDNFHVTDYIEIEVTDYPIFYKKLVEIYEETLRASSDNISQYYNIPVEITASFAKDDNLPFLLRSKYQYNDFAKNKKISLPQFAIERVCEKTIIQNIEKNPITVIYGHRFSGKTYVLYNIMRKTQSFNQYFFSSDTRLDNATLESLLSKKDVFLIFDERCLSELQLDKVFSSIPSPESNTKIILAMGTATKNAEVIINKLGKQNFFEISNKWKITEIKQINDKLGKMQIHYFDNPDKNKHPTLLDNLNKISDYNANSSLSKPRADTLTSQEVLILLLLAYKDELRSTELKMFHIESDIISLQEKVRAVLSIDYMKFVIIRHSRQHTDFCLVANAKYTIIKWLSAYLLTSEGIALIKKAYVLLVQSIKSQSLTDIIFNQRIKAFIRYDEMNDIFSANNTQTNYEPINEIYASLESELGFLYQYNHQRAVAMYRSSASKIQRIQKAFSYITLAKNNVEVMMQTSNSPKLKISYSHILFTYALILSKQAKIENYGKITTLSQSLSAFIDAIFNDINEGYASRLAKKDFSDLRDFITKLSSNQNTLALLSKPEKENLTRLLKFIRDNSI